MLERHGTKKYGAEGENRGLALEKDTVDWPDALSQCLSKAWRLAQLDRKRNWSCQAKTEVMGVTKI